MDEIRFPRPMAAFAQKAQIYATRLYKIEEGRVIATPEQAAKIHWATRGRISAHMLRPDLYREGQVPPNPFRVAPSGDTAPEAA